MTNENRRTIYEFLARTYAKEITIEHLKELSKKKDFFLTTAEQQEVQGTELAEGFTNLAKYLSSIEERDPESVRLELAVDYAGVFLGVWRTLPHPSESVYVTDKTMVMHETRDNVLKIYRSMGVDKVNTFHEPEDHIAMELQFMAILCDKTIGAFKEDHHADVMKCLEVQKDFLNDHLGKWVPRMAADVIATARKEFYKAIAKITKGYIEMDKEAVSEIIESLSESHE
jgi:anaerobic sulfite reductase subunit A